MCNKSIVKSVSFKNNIRDKKIFDFIKDKDFSYYVKDLIFKDMNKITCPQENKKNK